MLILNRHEGEEVVIGHDIRVVVVEIRGSGVVRLGIDAPRDVRVDRREVRDRIDAEANGRHAH